MLLVLLIRINTVWHFSDAQRFLWSKFSMDLDFFISMIHSNPAQLKKAYSGPSRTLQAVSTECVWFE